MCRKLFFSISYVLVLGLLVNPLAQAATRTWDHEGGDNLWMNAVNWSADKIPGSSDTAKVVLIAPDHCLVDALHVGDNLANPKNLHIGRDGGDGELRVTGGSLIAANILRVGNAATGTLTMSGGTVQTIGGAMDIGYNAGLGTVTLTDGTISVGPDGAATSALSIGRGSDSAGIFNMQGGYLDVSGTLRVGRGGGVGTLNMEGGIIDVGPGADPLVDTKAMSVGYQGGASGTVNMSDGIINVSGTLNVGQNTADGILDMLGGTINVGTELAPTDFRIGHREATGTVNVHAGAINVTGDLRVGSTYFEIIEEPYEEIPYGGTGRLTMTGGVINIPDANALQIGLDGSTGQVDLWGGTIMAGGLEIGGPGSGGILDIREGTLILNGDYRGEILDYISAGRITAYGGWSGAELQYDYCTTNFKRTTLTAIPEPATIALLALGGFALLRRRK
jgi:hypothetical protein